MIWGVFIAGELIISRLLLIFRVIIFAELLLLICRVIIPAKLLISGLLLICRVPAELLTSRVLLIQRVIIAAELLFLTCRVIITGKLLTSRRLMVCRVSITAELLPMICEATIAVELLICRVTLASELLTSRLLLSSIRESLKSALHNSMSLVMILWPRIPLIRFFMQLLGLLIRRFICRRERRIDAH